MVVLAFENLRRRYGSREGTPPSPALRAPPATSSHRGRVSCPSVGGGGGWGRRGHPPRTHIFCADARSLKPRSRGAIETPQRARESVWSAGGAPAAPTRRVAKQREVPRRYPPRNYTAVARTDSGEERVKRRL